MSYQDVMNQKNEIMRKALQMNYDQFEGPGIGFDYEKMMASSGYTLEDVIRIQKENNIGSTPMIELKRLSAYARKFAKPGYGARIFLKDESQNLSGSFKARRAAMSIYQAKKLGFKGVIAATSGNYGAAVAALAARQGLKCIIVQECYDSNGVGQPEIIEKARACQAYGAEVVQLSVGPELFYQFLVLLKETGYFNASLYSPYGVMGIETLGYEIAKDMHEKEGKYPEAVICTNAGGGNLTGTARGLKKAGATDTKIIAASVDLSGLHMASDHDFNLKSFTTGHTGFGIPFSTFPDRSDVPRSAARPLRYMDYYGLVNQGSVFFITEALAILEGMERGPAGNTSLALAFSLAQEMKDDEIIVVQETEYTGAGKHMNAQISFASDRGVELLMGNPLDEKPGKNLIFPSSGAMLKHKEVSLDHLRTSYLKRYQETMLFHSDYEYLALELKTTIEHVKKLMEDLNEAKN
ncbi:MAG: PLP-dependent lyase/thiolase [Tenericutes bacterium GWC2_34_14]|nr:MAG: PLP-dependent lyase/thiolase [Tenericutes bacterium GWC2_34_14]OHE35010.1 MAG: PLP-dependent lyase/thiolase [Tenericutes bacterium GWE2_34_108]OHE37130.1 MAG: PLP-dependent lyase/thiolase [Tenericutes bacterium GWF1_35_14]OHE39738.1 MAG: PLP-dependent lyase/thiolase [Tenericutes bacterium GWF2_35_184]OHE44008.1 MAG: PLP-dependent lyase/thiolase [Tenericutes bacterium RIFOXYA12_FULL_35_10]OHE44074.1 MAG: PLP-dependent lyase/thiolase [Tenericutes bacterium RIFOXYA2_FULL_36_32]OHE47500.1